MKETAMEKTAQSHKTADATREKKESSSLQEFSDPLTGLHQTLGNQAIQHLYKSGKLQAALKIGRPDDVYEHEADRMADHDMRMSDPAVQRKPG